MTIKNLPKLDPIQAHWLNSQPLDNAFATEIQDTEYYKETRNTNLPYWRIKENKLAYELKFNANSVFLIKQEAIDLYGEEAVNNASRHLSHLLKRSNIHPVSLQYAAISWYINQIVDIEKTKELNKWELKVWEPTKR